LDGFGCRKESDWNAIAQASKPVFSRLFADSSWTKLQASGFAVGLPGGQMGNSEVGHLNLGAGRVVDQDVVRISKAIDAHEMPGNQVLLDTVARCRRHGGRIHFVGLLSDGGVHSLQHHLHGLIDAAAEAGMEPVDGAPSLLVHALLDGRDTPPRSAIGFIEQLQRFLADRPAAVLSTIIGRYFTMDRDTRWDRTQRGYDLMTLGIGSETSHPIGCIERYYEAGVSDEFMDPIVVTSDAGHDGKIQDGDAVIFFNFRADRMRQIVTAFHDDAFDGFSRAIRPEARLVSMTSYHRDWTLPVLFAPVRVAHHVGEVIAAAGLRQLRIAETEKYAHVTFFFNGGSDAVSEGEKRVLVPSPKVATYDLQPEMSLPELTDRVIEAIDGGEFDLIVLNIANPDMVGHTGKMEAAVSAVEATDRAVGRILEAVERQEGVALITADHGNCELMFDPRTGQPHTAHTTNDVPLILFDPLRRFALRRERAALANVAPTLLEILALEKPEEMTAESLLEQAER
ncbi:MAG TPA: 2,3-bisphosphoglycerate-independent phosphoglycerate mutase, partial [Thermoanaerobaculia bacterium]|nr:2,3-bisphosphoglycerate-independent phosphoglycerate mutase [Thermoanaerobaculia bacterium]